MHATANVDRDHQVFYRVINFAHALCKNRFGNYSSDIFMKIDINNVNYVVGDHRTNYIAAIKKYNLEKRKPWKQVKMKFFKIGAHVFSKTFGFTYSSPDGPKIVKDF